MDNERKNMMIESRICMILPVRDRMAFTISSLSVWSKLFSWASENEGRNAENRRVLQSGYHGKCHVCDMLLVVDQ